jgi:hypothetical protein
VVYHRQISWNAQAERLHSLPTRPPRRCESMTPFPRQSTHPDRS